MFAASEAPIPFPCGFVLEKPRQISFDSPKWLKSSSASEVLFSLNAPSRSVAYSPLFYRLQDSILMQKKGAIQTITIDLGNRIRDLRMKSGLSQEKFALKIGMDRTYYASVESGKRNISIINIQKIANGLGVSLSELFRDL